MSTYKSPGVYVEEISVFPPSVAPVSTAVPAFVGCTAQATDGNGNSLTNIPTRISTFLDYQNLFGGPPPYAYTVTVTQNPDQSYSIQTIQSAAPEGGQDPTQFLLYYAVQLYFQNGGGPCYIVSVGDYLKPLSQALPIGLTGPSGPIGLDAALAALDAEDEPTILLVPEAVNLDAGDYQAACQALLTHAGNLKDRFAILDVQQTVGSKPADDATGFRDAVGSENLSYGAGYTPYLQTTLAEVNASTLVQSNVTVQGANPSTSVTTYFFEQNGCIKITSSSPNQSVTIEAGTGDDDVSFNTDATPGTLAISNVTAAISGQGKEASTIYVIGKQIVDAWNKVAPGTQGGFTIETSGTGAKEVTLVSTDTPAPLIPVTTSATVGNLDQLPDNGKSGLYNQILSALYARTVTLPPSAAIAGVYCAVDASRGVWKAPANVALLGVTAPTQKITQADQDGLNVDPSTGKSINAIRAFTGQGTMVWGARTLLGNDNNWRYVSVRRLFIFIEESIQQSTSWAVFEPNVTTTWIKVKASIESFLYGLWQQGALAGSTAQEAYFVNVGLGKTMTQADILAGNLIVQVGAAPSRPAEFVVLRIMQKLQGA